MSKVVNAKMYANKNNGDNDIYQQAVQIVLRDKVTAVAYLQRKMNLGYTEALKLIERMEKEGILSTPDLNGHRFFVGEYRIKIAKQIFQEMPNWLTMSPSNKCGEAKYNQEYTAFCEAIGFTNDKFEGCSEIGKLDNNTMLITYIYTVGKKEHTGYFKNLVKNLQSLGVEVMIDNPSTPRIYEIIERHNLKIACYARLLALGKL